MSELPRISPYGDQALLLQFTTGAYSAAINDAVHRLASRLRAQIGWIDVMTGYDSLVVSFDSRHISQAAAKRKVEDLLLRPDITGQNGQDIHKADIDGKVVEIPVFYGGDYGPDLHNICDKSGLSHSAVIEAHSQHNYRVCMMGFVPGFAFLSEIDPALHHPRHAKPRAAVPAGSVGIANWQTGIYGLDSPGGWQIIGQTPLKLFDKTCPEPFLVTAGDLIRFVPQ